MTPEQKRYIITGPPGSGKTSLIDALKQKGYTCVEESSRRFIREEQARGGDRLPWKDVAAFDEMVLKDRIIEYEKTKSPITFFDRGIPDSLAYLKLASITPSNDFLYSSMTYRYETELFFLPSWKEIYKTDESRKETFEQAQKIEQALKRVYYDLGYLVIILPKISVDERLQLIEKILQ